MTDITLPWMNKIRQMKGDMYTPRRILLELIKYGRSEEKRISDSFKCKGDDQ